MATAPANPTPSPALVIARTFQFELVTFKVEGKLYRVPRHGFTEFSEVFRTMFTLPQSSEGTSTEGQNDENPIELLSCTKLEFESLLEVLYPTAKPVSTELSRDQLVGVLSLSTQWAMDQIRAFCIEELSKLQMSSIDRILLGRQYDVEAWLMTGYSALVTSAGDLPQDSLEAMGNHLGWETAARIMELRVKAKPDPVLVMTSSGCRLCHRLLSAEYNTATKLKTSVFVCDGPACHTTWARVTKKFDREVPLAGEALKEAIKAAFPADFRVAASTS